MNSEKIEITYQFVPYGKEFSPQKDTLVLDVGMKTVPGVIDHHHPDAPVECAASLVAKFPHLVLDHIKPEHIHKEARISPLRIITHRFPDFDAVSSVFLAFKLLEKGEVDSSMQKIASYTKMVDSASLPKEIDLSSTPYSILRALYRKIRKKEDAANLARMDEGLKFMNFLYSKSEEGYEITQSRTLFSGIERYEKAMRNAEDDYFNYLSDIQKSKKIILFLPLLSGKGKSKVDGLIVKNPRSFLLKEWARRDRENSSLHQGFSFLMTNFGNKRYILGVDPEKGVNLRGLGTLLNRREAEKREAQGRPLDYLWYEGNCPFFNYRIVDSPQDETSLSQEEIVDAVMTFSQNTNKN
ncbi:MAG: hypothetical protein ACLFVG_10645 [Candidatus Aminicenantes bacterium]